jgi:hypothetical protein
MAAFVVGALIAGAVVAGVTAVTATAAAIAAGAISAAFMTTFATSLVIGGLSRALAKKPANPDAGLDAASVFAAQGRNFSIRQPIAPWQVVVGQARVGGVVTFAYLTDDKKYLHMVITLACHECEEVGNVYLDDEVITSAMLDSSGNVTSGRYAFSETASSRVARRHEAVLSGLTATTSYNVSSVQAVTGIFEGESGQEWRAATEGVDYTRSGNVFTFDASYSSAVSVVIDYTEHVATSSANSLLRIQKNLGTSATSQPFPDLVTESGGKWTSAHRQQGHTKIYLRFDTRNLESNLPQISAVVKGWKHYDPRTATTVYSANPALALAHYFTDTEFGLGATYSTEIDEDALTAAANECDEDVTLASGSTENRYEANGSFLTSERPGDVAERLVNAMAGRAAHISDRWHIFAGAYEAPTVTLDEDEIAGVVRIDAMPARDEWANAVRGVFVDPNNRWQPTDFPALISDTYTSQDGGERIWADLDLTGFETSAARAQRLAKVELLRRRNPLTFSTTWRLSAWRAMTARTVAVNFTRYGWSSKVFEVVESRFVVIESDDGPALGVEMVMRETGAAIYDWATSEEQTQDLTPNTTLPNPASMPAALTGVAVESGTDQLIRGGDGTIITRALVSWTESADSFVRQGGRIELEFKRAAETEFGGTQVLRGAVAEAYVAPLVDGEPYLFRVRPVTSFNVAGLWTTVAHTVLGKTEPPSDVTGFTIEGTRATWTLVDDLDVVGYRIRYQPGTSRSWGNAIPLHEGLITDTRWELPVIPFVRSTMLIKAVDSSGNESQSPAFATAFFDVTLGDPQVANILLTYDRRASDYPGTLTNGARTSGLGELVADSAVAFWNANTAAQFWANDTTSVFWPADFYKEMTYVDTITVDDTLTGSLITIQSTITGDPWSVEYRENSAALFWPADNAGAFWNADTSDFFWDQPAWLAWPGSLLSKSTIYDFRITTAQSATQGIVNGFTITVDAPDINEAFEDVAIAAGGSRLPITNSYRVIKNVLITVQNDGGNAITARIEDKDEDLGPLIKCLDAAGSAVSGTIDARIQGY